jgi:hypothetical protein
MEVTTCNFIENQQRCKNCTEIKFSWKYIGSYIHFSYKKKVASSVGIVLMAQDDETYNNHNDDGEIKTI